MFERLVFIDLETTGLSPEQDRIIEFGAVRVEGGEVVDRFSRLCNPGRRVPLLISQLTGISNAEVQAAEPLADVLIDFLDFIGQDICVAHNAPFEVSFLQAATRGFFRGTVLDSVEVARIALPTLRSHRLEALLKHYGVGDTVPHRAAADAEFTAQIWQHLTSDLTALPLAVLSELTFTTAGINHPLVELLRTVESDALGRGFGRKAGQYKDLLENHRELVTYRPPPPEEGSRPEAPEPAVVVETLGADGPIARELRDYELRPQQLEMAQAVSQALAEGRHLIAEAGTGVGKSLAYLVPAIMHAKQTGEKVVVSTHTKNLQAQLFYKDLPLVARALGVEFKAALIKGRQNYVCLRRLINTIREAARELSTEERLALLPVITWAASTRSGDLDECAALSHVAPGLRARLVTSGEECLGRASPYFNHCFPRMNRGLALQADVVVANHALVFSELGLDSVVLPPHPILVLDEAHNVEDVATEHLAAKVNRFRIYRVLNRLWRAPRGKSHGGTGLLASVFNQVNASAVAAGLDAELVDLARKQTSVAIDAMTPVVPAIDEFFAAVAPLCQGPDDRTRLRREAIRPSIRQPLEQAKSELVSSCAALTRKVEALLDTLRELRDQGLPYARDFLKELEAQVLYLREILNDLDFIMQMGEDDFVYWVEVQDPLQARYELAAAPLDVSRLLFDQVYSPKRSVILTSATMTVANRFGFMKRRLGLDLIEEDGLSEVAVGTPYDFNRQCRLLVPAFLPDPSSREFTDAVAELMSALFRQTRGRGLGLFTSYAMLRRAARGVRAELEADSIQVMVQGSDGSREALLEQFARDVNSVLLGTSSFWEGVDVKGEALSALVVAKLPFEVPSDPIIKGRCERVEAEGGNAFMEYSLPMAVLRLRQGVGRLIRSATDRGIAVLADNRLLKKRYGSIFLRSMPTRHRVVRSQQELLDIAGEFLRAEDEQASPRVEYLPDIAMMDED